MKVNLSPALIRQYVIAIIVNFGALTTGLSLGWPSPVLVKLRNGTDIPLPRPITEEEGSWIVSGGHLAIIAVNLLGGMLIDRIGRRYCVILLSIPKILLAIWTIFVSEVWMLIFCRVAMVICDCFVMVLIPAYVSEIACKEHRGSLGSLLNLFLSLGTVISLSVGPFLSYVSFNTFIAVIIAVTTLPLVFIPETPIFLYNKGRAKEATEVLNLIRDSHLIIMEELENYKLSSNEDNIAKMTLFKNKLFLKSLLLGIIVCVSANVTGYIALSFYLQTILESSKTSLRPETASVIIGSIQLFAAICTSFITKHIGRKPILCWSLSGMCCGMVGLSTYFSMFGTDGYTDTGFMNYLPLLSLMLVVFCFSIGIGNLMFVVPPELFDGPARAFGMSICLLPGALATFVLSKYLAQIISAVGPALPYIFFSAMCILFIILIMIFLPETKGKTFNQIQVELKEKNVYIQCSRNNNIYKGNKCPEKK